MLPRLTLARVPVRLVAVRAVDVVADVVVGADVDRAGRGFYVEVLGAFRGAFSVIVFVVFVVVVVFVAVVSFTIIVPLISVVPLIAIMSFAVIMPLVTIPINPPLHKLLRRPPQLLGIRNTPPIDAPERLLLAPLQLRRVVRNVLADLVRAELPVVDDLGVLVHAAQDAVVAEVEEAAHVHLHVVEGGDVVGGFAAGEVAVGVGVVVVVVAAGVGGRDDGVSRVSWMSDGSMVSREVSWMGRIHRISGRIAWVDGGVTRLKITVPWISGGVVRVSIRLSSTSRIPRLSRFPWINTRKSRINRAT